jgi:tRNA (adenine22-N1)-methyltransferase
VRLPPRLQATLELVPAGARSAADVGSGHGALAAAMAAGGLRVIATERTDRSFAALRRDVARVTALTGTVIETRLGDGLAALHPGEVEVVVIAGLGGRSLVRMLVAAPWLPAWLVLQPMQDTHLAAAWLHSRGWAMHEARIVQGGRWYLGWRVEVPPAAREHAA